VESSDVSALLDSLRKKVEVENEAIRLDVPKYDSVNVDRRESIWRMRRELLASASFEQWLEKVEDLVSDLAEALEEDLKQAHVGLDSKGDLDSALFYRALLEHVFGRALDEPAAGWPVERDKAIDFILDAYRDRFGSRHDEELMRWERRTLLSVIDELWTQFLTDVERVEEGIGLRGYGNLDPLVEFRREVGLIYKELVRDINLHAIRLWLRVDPKKVEEAAARRESKAPELRKSIAPRKQHAALDRLPRVRPGGRRRKRKN